MTLSGLCHAISPRAADALKIAGIKRDHQIKFALVHFGQNRVAMRDEAQVRRDAVVDGRADDFSHVSQRAGQTQEGTDSIAIGRDMRDEEDRL